ncbi:MAG TPA: TerB family tellurite resistance protein [Lutibacter sp.]|nr:TerB family tellurite resistance protein [Lutibacter sp.]
MSFLDLFTSGEHKRAKTYFSALIQIAFADSSMDKKELKYLEKMAHKLDISDAEFTRIIEHPEKYPIDPPIDYNDRIEQLFNLTHMIASDEEIKLDEAKIVRKLAVGLGFPVDNAEKVTDEAIHLVMNANNLEDFSKAIKEVNKF